MFISTELRDKIMQWVIKVSNRCCIVCLLFSVADSGEKQGGHAPPWPVNNSHKKDGRPAQQLIFHDS